MLSRFIRAAFSGTITERNTRVSSMNESRITAAINSGSRSLTRVPMSPNVAV